MTDRGNFSLRTFLDENARKTVRSAVEAAEARSAGEIRVMVVEKSRAPLSRLSDEKAVEQRAEREFLRLGIQNTAGRTGVLIMISLREHRVCVKADQAIHKLVGEAAWQSAVDTIVAGIKAGRQAAGICDAVAQVGEVLARHFPRQVDDVDELPNEVVMEE
jgi:uncharacterized membrane protein